VSSYVLSADAAFDLEDIWEYIAADNIDAADRWIERLFEAFEGTRAKRARDQACHPKE
jgi:plasmid stabilization system protein ParE